MQGGPETKAKENKVWGTTASVYRNYTGESEIEEDQSSTAFLKQLATWKGDDIHIAK